MEKPFIHVCLDFLWELVRGDLWRKMYLGYLGLTSKNCRFLGNVASNEGLVVVVKAGRGVLGFLLAADFGNQSSICPS